MALTCERFRRFMQINLETKDYDIRGYFINFQVVIIIRSRVVGEGVPAMVAPTSLHRTMDNFRKGLPNVNIFS